MPLLKSAKKALRVDRANKIINNQTRNKVKTALKAARLAIAEGRKDSKEKIAAAYRELDLAAKKNVIHKNRASRLKSRLAKKFRPKVDQPLVEAKKKTASEPKTKPKKKSVLH